MNELPIFEIVATLSAILFALASVALVLLIDDLLDKRRKRMLTNLLAQAQLLTTRIQPLVDEPDDFAIKVVDALLARLGHSDIKPDQIVDYSDQTLERVKNIIGRIRKQIDDTTTSPTDTDTTSIP